MNTRSVIYKYFKYLLGFLDGLGFFPLKVDCFKIYIYNVGCFVTFHVSVYFNIILLFLNIFNHQVLFLYSFDLPPFGF